MSNENWHHSGSLGRMKKSLKYTQRRWQPGRRGPVAEAASTAKAGAVLPIVGLIISIVALAVSGFTAFYSLLDERYDLRMLTSYEVPLVADSTPPQMTSDYTLTFINGGNRPVSVVEVAFVAQPTSKKFEDLDAFNCEADMWGPNKFQRAYPAEFTPVTIKAGEIESRVLHFSAPVDDATAPNFRDGSNYHLLSCLQVAFAWAGGRYIEIIPYAWSPRSSGGGRAFVDVKYFHGPEPVRLLNSRWPFKPAPLASR